MYKISTQSKFLAVTVVALTTILFATAAVAGPGKGKGKAFGKPGINPFAPGGNIVEVALAANDALGGGVFETVYTAATCDYFGGAIASILVGEDKVTLFAPTNAAFDALEDELELPEGSLSAGMICDTFAGDPAALAGILAYHVSDGRRFSNSVLNKNGNKKEIEMLANGSIVTKDGKIYDNNMRQVNIGIANVNASNGVIHVIDTVLLP